ncbi:MAG: NAD(P)-binding protein [Roseivirga sp.]|nr:NAD(P)-binding protein [Roseivirga sp.]
MTEVIIIGAGLAGLTAAYRLKKSEIPFRVVEARDRIGGRIHTLSGPIEMGATWFGSQHIHLRQFLTELEVENFEQFTKGKISYDLHPQAPAQYMEMPAGQAPSYRIKGGTTSLINRLVSELDPKQIQLNTSIESIHDKGGVLLIKDKGNQEYQASLIISTIPPQLMANVITFEPALPAATQKLMSETHTWMGESIKFALSYTRPFWKENGFSGMGFAQTGVIEEIHDHSNAEETFFSLKGFLRTDLSELTRSEREQLVKAQVVKLFGPEAADYIGYQDRVWIDEEYTSVKSVTPLMPHQNNGHPELNQPLMNQKLLIAGTESSPVYGGYMEGAVYAGTKAAQQVERLLKTTQSS